jgi:large subunit ribosomal protein L4
MPTVAVKTRGGGSAGEVSLSERIWGAPRNIPLMHQAVRTEMQNSRQDTKNTKTRGDILGGGKKPWRQKGTGRARQGSIVAPHWRHGGVAHGPHPRDLGHQMPKKMRRAAIFSALSAKLADDELVIIDGLGLDRISTKAAAAFLAELGVKKSLIILETPDDVAQKSLRNIAGVTLRVAPAFSTRDVVDGGTVIVTRGAVDKIEATWGDSGNGAAAEPAAAAEETEDA